MNMSNEYKYKVSVIVPVYNTKKYLRKCLDSLVTQTLKNIEIILINDGSTDGSLDILKEYDLKYKNIKLYSQSNHGLYYARKIGLKKANGEYVGWVDSDDFVDKNMFFTLYNLAKSKTADVAYCNYYFYPQKSNTKEVWFRKFKGEKDVNFVERNSQPWNKIVKTELLNKLNIGNIFEECFDEAYIKVLINCSNPVYTNKKLYYYRITDNSMSSNYINLPHYLSFITASENLKKNMDALCSKNSYWNAYFNYRIIYYSLLSLIIAANADNKQEFYRQREVLKEKFPHFRQNMHLKTILSTNFSRLKYFVITYIVPLNYTVTKTICKCIF